MELRHIRYFLAIAQEQHFTRAAQKLGIGQPPLSHQIKDLEREIGAPLFHRLPHGAMLTEAGKVFLDRINIIPGLVSEAVTAAQKAARGEIGAIRVGFTGSAAFNPRVPLAIRGFRRRFPEVEVTLQEGASNELANALLGNGLDAAILRPEGISGSDLRIHEIEIEPLIAALPAARMPHDDPIELQILAADPFVMTPRALGPTLFDATLDACRAAGFEPVLTQTAPQVASVLALVAAEIGVALVPRSMRDTPLRGVTYHDLTGVVPTTLLAVATRRDERSPVVAEFVKQARYGSNDEWMTGLHVVSKDQE